MTQGIIEKLKKELSEVQRDRAKCMEILDTYYTMNQIGNKQEFEDAHNRARRYIESKRIKKRSINQPHASCCICNEPILPAPKADPQIDTAAAYMAGFEASEKLQPKPLRWRTGPVEEAGMILCEIGHYDPPLYITAKVSRGGIEWPYTRDQVTRWLPLSDILDLVGGE